MEKILVINNDIDTMSLLKDLLAKKRYDVIYTGNGAESAALAKEIKPSLVLIDILHKEHIEEFKKDPATAHVPIILMTGYTWSNESQNNTDADFIIEKPFFLEELEQKIQTAFTKKRQVTKL